MRDHSTAKNYLDKLRWAEFSQTILKGAEQTGKVFAKTIGLAFSSLVKFTKGAYTGAQECNLEKVWEGAVKIQENSQSKAEEELGPEWEVVEKQGEKSEHFESYEEKSYNNKETPLNSQPKDDWVKLITTPKQAALSPITPDR